MAANEKDYSFVQCRNCGNIYKVEYKLPVDALIVEMVCPKCEYEWALNCGDDQNELYFYADMTLDSRYYTY